MTSTEVRAREEICQVGRSLCGRGYVHATAGNISVRLDDGFLITPTDACLGTLRPERLARLDASGTQTSGDRGSKVIALHRRIYKATASTGAAAGCVIHTHSTHLVACSIRADAAAEGAIGEGAELLPPITPYFVMKVGHVPHIAYRRPGDPDTAQAVADAIARHHVQGQRLRAAMLARLGPLAWHQTPAEALAVLEEMEETARLHWMLPDVQPLNTAQIDALRDAFGASW